MFKIGAHRLTWVQVKWNGLDEEGHQVENEIELQMDLVDRDQMREQLTAEDTPEGSNKSEEFLHRITHGWRKVGDAEGKPLPFTKENFAALLQCPGVIIAVGQAYGRAWAGMGKEREGNSATSPAAGGQAGAEEAKAQDS